MIYDKQLTVYTLAPGKSPLVRRLEVPVEHYYCEREVYAARYYAGRQAGSKITRMVSVPRQDCDSAITSDQYCVLEDGHVYRIDQAQYGYDDNGQPITTLSLAEPEGKYELYKS